MKKICNKCGTEKCRDEFPKLRGSVCKKCLSEYAREYRRKNKKKLKNYQKKYYSDHKDKFKDHNKNYYNANREYIRKQQKKYYLDHTEACLENMRRWQQQNPDKKRNIDKEYFQKNKKRIYLQRNKKRNEDVCFKMGHLLRNRVLKVLKGKQKSKPTLKLLGCSLEFLKEHLRRTAIKNGYENFDINNYDGSEYHIDHIIPCSHFDLSNFKEQEKCFHWTNLQILTWKDNMEKGDNYEI